MTQPIGGVPSFAGALDVTNRVAPQEPQGNAFDLSLSDGTPGPNKEPLNMFPSVEKVDAPKSGGIPVFGPKKQMEAGATARPEEEESAPSKVPLATACMHERDAV